jgi:hypothetical protein
MYDRLQSSIIEKKEGKGQEVSNDGDADGARLSTINFAISTQVPRLDLGSTSKIWRVLPIFSFAGMTEPLVARIGSS